MRFDPVLTNYLFELFSANMTKRSFLIDAPLHSQQHLYPAPIPKTKKVSEEFFVPSFSQKIGVKSQIFTNAFDIGLEKDYIDHTLVKRVSRQKSPVLSRLVSGSACLKGRFSNELPYLGYPLLNKKEKPVNVLRLLRALHKIDLNADLLKQPYFFRSAAHGSSLGFLINSCDQNLLKNRTKFLKNVSFTTKVVKTHRSSKWKVEIGIGFYFDDKIFIPLR